LVPENLPALPAFAVMAVPGFRVQVGKRVMRTADWKTTIRWGGTGIQASDLRRQTSAEAAEEVAEVGGPRSEGQGLRADFEGSVVGIQV